MLEETKRNRKKGLNRCTVGREEHLNAFKDHIWPISQQLLFSIDFSLVHSSEAINPSYHPPLQTQALKRNILHVLCEESVFLVNGLNILCLHITASEMCDKRAACVTRCFTPPVEGKHITLEQLY